MRGASAGTCEPVVVTGAGLVTGFGDLEATWAALVRADSAVALHDLGENEGRGVPGVPAAPPADEDLFGAGKLAKYMSGTARLAVASAGAALRSAGLLGDRERTRSMGLFVATGRIGFDLGSVSRAIDLSRDGAGELDLARFGREGLRACQPLLPFKMLLNMPLGLVSIVLAIGGPNFAVYPDAEQAGACFEGAVRRIRRGELAAALVGGVQAGFSLFPLAMLARSEAHLPEPSVDAVAPLRRSHRGLALADAGAFVVLESESSARARGATPLSYVRGVAADHCSEAAPHAPGGARTRTWVRALGPSAPDLFVTSGTRNWDQDVSELHHVQACWPQASVRALDYDGQLGDAGPAALACGAALATCMLARGHAPAMRGPVDEASTACRPVCAPAAVPVPGRVLVSARGPQGGGAALVLDARGDLA